MIGQGKARALNEQEQADAYAWVSRPDGPTVLGEIDGPAAAALKVSAGPIRLPWGIRESWGFGLQHVEYHQDRVRAITRAGFANARTFIQEVAANWHVAYAGSDGRFLLVWEKGGYDLRIVVEWREPDWSITTAIYSRACQGQELYRK